MNLNLTGITVGLHVRVGCYVEGGIVAAVAAGDTLSSGGFGG